jgi:MFS family permease
LPAPADTDNSCSSDSSAGTRRSPFSALRIRNYRLFASGQLVSNTGSWVQRIAQDWLVLSLTGSASAVGFTTALQFLPMVLFGMYGGLLADRYSKRRLLLITAAAMSLFAATLAVLTLSGRIEAWHVYVVAFGLGTVIAVDNPTRQAFVNEMVGPEDLRSAISLNSSVFQLGGLIGPAISGVLISAVGSGYAFAVNAATYIGPVIALCRMRSDQLHLSGRPPVGPGQVRTAIQYAAKRPHVLWPTVLVGVFGMFTANLAVTLASYAKNDFHSGAGGYGLLTSLVAIGSVGGALVSARRPQPRIRTLLSIGAVLAVLYVLAAAVASPPVFCVLLVSVGGCTLLLLTSSNSTVQLAAQDTIRGRVMALYLLVFIGSAAIGGPLIGAIDQHFGARGGLLLAGLVPGLATALIAMTLISHVGGGRTAWRTLRTPATAMTAARQPAL